MEKANEQMKVRIERMIDTGKKKEDKLAHDVRWLTALSYIVAVTRGKVGKWTRHDDRVRAIKEELREFAEATPKKSEHLPEYSEQEEELADIILVCLTSLAELRTDVVDLLNKKIRFNYTRKD